MNARHPALGPNTIIILCPHHSHADLNKLSNVQLGGGGGANSSHVDILGLFKSKWLLIVGCVVGSERGCCSWLG